jgi:hypothetical protein
VIKHILNNQNINTKGKREIKNEYDRIIDIENCINELLTTYNKNNDIKLSLHFTENRYLVSYLFLIFYKIYLYLNGWLLQKKKSGDVYFKDFLGFASRHSNLQLYNEIILNLSKHRTKEEATDIFYQLINQPTILEKYIYTKKYRPLSINPLYSNIPDDIDKNYGDPNVSFISYFLNIQFFNEDWFNATELDVYSTFFDIPNDGSILVENRIFFDELKEFIKDETGPRLDRYPIFDLYNKVGNKLIEQKKINDLSAYEWNSKTQKYIKKCKKGTFRSKKTRKCVKISKK